MARRKLLWSSAVHLIRGSLDLTYRLTAPFLPPLPISELARDLLLPGGAHARRRPRRGERSRCGGGKNQTLAFASSRQGTSRLICKPRAARANARKSLPRFLNWKMATLGATSYWPNPCPFRPPRKTSMSSSCLYIRTAAYRCA
jgi:hypothetical protein